MSAGTGTGTGTLPGPRRGLFGPLMMALAMFLFSMNDAIMKWLTAVGELPLYQVLVLRSAFIMIFMAVVCIARWGVRPLLVELKKPGYTLLGWSEVVVAVPYIYALKLLPLQTAQPIIKLSPLFAVLMAVLIFGQRSSLLRWSSITLGLAGVVAIVNPFGGFEASFLIALPMIGALVLGTRDVLTNRHGTQLDPFIVAFSMGWAMFVMAMAAQGLELDGPWRPMNSHLIWLTVALFAVTPTAYVCRVIAVQHGEMSAIAPLTYSGMIWAMIFGVWFFADPLGLGQLVGAGLIACGGLLLVWFDRGQPKD